jgi:hypothetical protein
MTQAAGLPLVIPFEIPAYWTPEQAQAVIELLDDLRERILAHYQLQLADLYREQQGRHIPEQASASDDDPIF